VIDANIEADLLEDYDLVKGAVVEVELLVAAGVGAVPAGPRVVEGTVAGATGRVLVLDSHYSRGVTRVPWPAIALIRAAPPATHPAL